MPCLDPRLPRRGRVQLEASQGARLFFISSNMCWPMSHASSCSAAVPQLVIHLAGNKQDFQEMKTSWQPVKHETLRFCEVLGPCSFHSHFTPIGLPTYASAAGLTQTWRLPHTGAKALKKHAVGGFACLVCCPWAPLRRWTIG